MAGHSKWANIKHRKAAQDARRGKMFTKVIREITVAARSGGADDNPRLRVAMDKAFAINMKKDTIEKAIQRGVGGGDDSNYEELTYEGYAPGGVAVYVEAMTDNRNRTVADVRHAFTKAGGNLGTDGSVAYLFEKKGVFNFEPGTDEEAVLEAGLEAGAEDLQAQDDGSLELQCPPEVYADVVAALAAAGLTAANAEVTMVPTTTVSLEGEAATTVLKMIDMLEDLDDVQNVYSNAEFSEDALNDQGA